MQVSCRPIEAFLRGEHKIDRHDVLCVDADVVSKRYADRAAWFRRFRSRGLLPARDGYVYIMASGFVPAEEVS